MARNTLSKRHLFWAAIALAALCLKIDAPVRAEDFTVIVLPDTQYYSQSYPEIFLAQVQWIVENKDALNIVYVAHVGDIVQVAGNEPQWQNADAAMSLLEDPVMTGLEEGIPYGVVPGNHDEPTTLYNAYFGVARFCDAYPGDCRSYYGDGYPYGYNDSNYTMFSAGGMDFVVVNLDYDPGASALNWADGVLKAHAGRRGIVVSHSIIQTGDPGSFTSPGLAIYEALKDNPNLFLMLCGHLHGEGKRVDIFDESAVHTLLADYQGYESGGNGYLRIMHFSAEENEIRVETYSPWLDRYETDADSQFVLSYDMGSVCPNPPVKVASDFYSSLQDAYAAANDGETILAQEWTFDGDLIADSDKRVFLAGGFDCQYTENPGDTSVGGAIVISAGTVIFEKIIIQEPQ